MEEEDSMPHEDANEAIPEPGAPRTAEQGRPDQQLPQGEREQRDEMGEDEEPRDTTPMQPGTRPVS